MNETLQDTLPIRKNQCATCINGDKMFEVEDMQENKNNVAFAIQKIARKFQCPLWEFKRW
jgi:hypothetical protein